MGDDTDSYYEWVVIPSREPWYAEEDEVYMPVVRGASEEAQAVIEKETPSEDIPF